MTYCPPLISGHGLMCAAAFLLSLAGSAQTVEVPITALEIAGENVALVPGTDGKTGKPTRPLWWKQVRFPLNMNIEVPGGKKLVHGLRYLPRQSLEIQYPTAYRIELSEDGKNYEKVAQGRWDADSALKIATFPAAPATRVRLVITEAFNAPQLGRKPSNNIVSVSGIELLTGSYSATSRADIRKNLTELIGKAEAFGKSLKIAQNSRARFDAVLAEIHSLDPALATPEDVARAARHLVPEMRRLSTIGRINTYHPGEIWLDTDGNPVNAHGGGILHDPKSATYYWYGESKTRPNSAAGRTDIEGVACYSSKDLYNWKSEGLVLKAFPDDPNHDLHPSNVLERPKVIHNLKTGKYVMWMHLDNAAYRWARAATAVADSPTGPFTYLKGARPLDNESRDMTLYADDDGKGYLIYSSESNRTLHFALLTEDYLDLEGTVTRVFPGRAREAPAIFKSNGRYHMITSGLTGWAPNPAEYAVAPSITGPWKAMRNPCIGDGAETTYGSQGTFVIKSPGGYDTWIFMADRWTPRMLMNSRYVWLPIELDGDEMTIRWYDQWSYQNQ